MQCVWLIVASYSQPRALAWVLTRWVFRAVRSLSSSETTFIGVNPTDWREGMRIWESQVPYRPIYKMAVRSGEVDTQHKIPGLLTLPA